MLGGRASALEQPPCLLLHKGTSGRRGNRACPQKASAEADRAAAVVGSAWSSESAVSPPPPRRRARTLSPEASGASTGTYVQVRPGQSPPHRAPRRVRPRAVRSPVPQCLAPRQQRRLPARQAPAAVSRARVSSSRGPTRGGPVPGNLRRPASVLLWPPAPAPPVRGRRSAHRTAGPRPSTSASSAWRGRYHPSCGAASSRAASRSRSASRTVSGSRPVTSASILSVSSRPATAGILTSTARAATVDVSSPRDRSSTKHPGSAAGPGGSPAQWPRRATSC